MCELSMQLVVFDFWEEKPLLALPISEYTHWNPILSEQFLIKYDSTGPD